MGPQIHQKLKMLPRNTRWKLSSWLSIKTTEWHSVYWNTINDIWVEATNIATTFFIDVYSANAIVPNILSLHITRLQLGTIPTTGNSITIIILIAAILVIDVTGGRIAMMSSFVAVYLYQLIGYDVWALKVSMMPGTLSSLLPVELPIAPS